jgi:hypothetical protein
MKMSGEDFIEVLRIFGFYTEKCLTFGYYIQIWNKVFLWQSLPKVFSRNGRFIYKMPDGSIRTKKIN